MNITKPIAYFFVFIALFGFLSTFVASSVTPTFAQEEIEVESKEINYTLPHAGLLPDSPLYPIKRMRDALWLFFTRDSLEKAELLRLFTDKKIVMAQAMAEKGKWDLAVETAEISEKDFARMIEAMEMAKKIGSAPTGDFLIQVNLSNEKHFEIMEDILIKAPQGVRMRIEEVMQTNVDHHNALEAL